LKTKQSAPPAVSPAVTAGFKPPGLRFEVLDAARGIGALLVIVGHYHGTLWPERGGFITQSSGYLVVDVFFLLSGFVLAHAFFDKPGFDYREFAKKRVFRLWPLHMATLCLYVLLMLLAGDPISEKGLLLNILLLHNVGMGHWPMIGFNYPSWSLSVELVSNLVVGLIILAIPSRRWNTLALAALSLASVTLIVLTVENLDLHTRNVLGFVNTGLLRCFITFPLGILTYRLFMARRSWFAHSSPAYSVLVGVLIAVFFVTLCVPGRALTDLLYIPFYALIIMLLASPGPLWTRYLSQFRFLGSISFSVYLIHAPVLKFMQEIAFWPRDYAAGLVIAIALSLILGTAAHYTIERPSYDWFTRRWSKQTQNSSPVPAAGLPGLACEKPKRARSA
jgi:peptidoglycan/LPS O-acetylase OafA/YrhL